MQTSKPSPSLDVRWKSIGAGLFFCALVFRLITIDWGLPNEVRNWSLHVDEPVVYEKYAMQIAPWNLDFEPGEYNYPSFYPLVLRTIGEAVARFSGVAEPSADSEIGVLRNHMATYHRTGRVISAVAGSVFALLTFLILRREIGLFGGLVGGALATAAPLASLLSRFQTVDMLSSTLFLASIAASIILARSAGPSMGRIAILAGSLAGLAAGTKYTGFAALGSLLAACFICERRHWYRPFGLGSIACVGAFLFSTPGAFTNPQALIGGIRLEAAHSAEGHGLAFVGTLPGWLFHLQNLWYGVGPLALALGLMGVTYGLYTRQHWMWVFAAGTVPLYVVVGMSEVKLARYILPVLPLIIAGAACTVVEVRKRQRWLGTAAAIAIVVGFDASWSGLRGSAQLAQWMLQSDPRDEAGRLLKVVGEQSPTTVALVQKPWFWTVSVVPDATRLFILDDREVQRYLASTRSPQVVYGSAPQPPDFVVYSDFEVQDVRRLRNHGSVPNAQANYIRSQNDFLDSIEASYEVVARIGGEAPPLEDMQYVRPGVTILRRRGIHP